MIKVNVNEVKNRKLENCYIVWYIVTYPVPYLSNNLIEYKDLYIIYGVNIKGKRKIIGMYFDNTEDNRFWLEELEDIKKRNVEKILFIIMKKNRNLERAIKIIYNSSIIIESAIDIINTISKYLPTKRSSDTSQYLKKLFLAEDINSYKIELELIKEKYKDDKIITILLEKQLPIIESYYKYDKCIRTLIFPYFSIRDMQCKIRKIGNNIEYFENIDSIINALIKDINSFEYASSYGKKEWLIVMNVLYSIFKEEIEVYL